MKKDVLITRKGEIYKVTILGSVVNFVLVVLKLLAGILGRSSAMIADGVHSLSDFVTDVIVLIFVNVASQPRDERHNYGHGKFETLATVLVGVILFFVGLFLFWESLQKIISAAHGDILPRPHGMVLIIGFVSIISKEWLFRVTRKVARKINSPVLEANGWHHRSDAMSSIGVVIGVGGAMLFSEKWRVLDPIAAAIVSVFILKVAYDIIVPAIKELLEISLSVEVQNKINDIILSVDNTLDPHSLRTRSVGANYSIEFHVRVDGEMSVKQSHDIVDEIEKKLRLEFGQETFLSIHVEPVKKQCNSRL